MKSMTAQHTKSEPPSTHTYAKSSGISSSSIDAATLTSAVAFAGPVVAFDAPADAFPSTTVPGSLAAADGEDAVTLAPPALPCSGCVTLLPTVLMLLAEGAHVHS